MRISDGSRHTRIADGVNHVHESVGNMHAATPRHFLWGAGATLRGMGLMVVALIGALALASSAHAQASVGLGTADGFGVLGGTTVTNTGPTVVNGDLGVSPGTAVTGFPPGTVNGTIHAADAVAAQAQSDTTTAYNDAAGRACTGVLTGQDLGGMTLTAGVYCFSSSAQLTGTVTLDAQGDPGAVFIFKIGSTLTTASGSNVNLINGAQSCNVFWQVGSSATLGTTTTFRGNILALTSITATTGATVDGRLLARNGAATLDSNTVTRARCATASGPAPGPGAGPGPGTGPGTTPGTGTGTGPGTTPGTGTGTPPQPDRTRPTVSIAWPPGGGVTGPPGESGKTPCLARDFRVRITARDGSGIRKVKVYLDGRLIKGTTSTRFFVRISAKRLGAGLHTIRVVARDREGNQTTMKRRFLRCAHPVLPQVPQFTG